MMRDLVNAPPLGETSRDTSVSLAKAALGSVPVVGSVLAEMVGITIRNQRLDRIETYLLYLHRRLDSPTEDQVQPLLKDAEAVDLIEEGAIQSARAISDERKAYIVELVAGGITGDTKAKIEAKRLLKLLESIDDDQIIILTSHLYRYQHNAEWRERHSRVLEPVRSTLGSTPADRDAATIYELTRTQLQQIGLLRTTFKSPKKGEMPEFDPKTGMLKSGGRELAPLGRLLLRQIGLAAEEEI